MARRARKAKSKNEKRVLPIRKMTEKFARNPSAPADSDEAKRVYYLTENRWERAGGERRGKGGGGGGGGAMGKGEEKGCCCPSAAAESDEAKRVYYLTENR